MKKALVGNGGFATDIKALLNNFKIPCFVDDEYYTGQKGVLPLSDFDPSEYALFVTIADPMDRANLIARLPEGTKYFNVIHKSAQLMGEIKIGIDCVVSANSIIVSGTVIGDHCHFNLGTIIGHGVQIGNYFTGAPGVKIMGNNWIGDYVYMGTNSCTKQKIIIGNSVIVGLNAGVISDLIEAGTYIGTPARRIK